MDVGMSLPWPSPLGDKGNPEVKAGLQVVAVSPVAVLQEEVDFPVAVASRVVPQVAFSLVVALRVVVSQGDPVAAVDFLVGPDKVVLVAQEWGECPISSRGRQ